MKVLIFVSFLVASILSYNIAIASTQSTDTLDPIRISIETTASSVLGEHELVDVMWEAGSYEIGGFDFLIGYDATILSFQTATPGPAMFSETDSSGCNWDYFTYRYGAQGNCDSTCPSGMLRVIGIADIHNGLNYPTCYEPNQLPAVLFSLDFLIRDSRESPCKTVPINFLWLDCGDNTISTRRGDTLYHSQSIVDFDGSDITDPESGWPTYTGAQSVCSLGGGPGKPIPSSNIEFINGGINVACPDTLPLYGDFNQNNIANEIADALLFSNYFTYGIGVFDIDYMKQVAVSDINQDGVTLTIEDFTYLIRIVVGDAVPNPISLADTAYVTVDDKDLNIVAPPSDSIGAAYIIVDGNATPILPVNLHHFSIKYAYDATDDITRVLIWSFEYGNSFGSGKLLSFTKPESLLYVDVATYHGGAVETIFRDPLPTSFALHQNYPNPFNLSTMISFDLPNSSSVRLTIYNNLGQSLFERVAGFTAGTHTIEWDGSDRAGNTVASGIYYYRIEADSFTETRKMLLLK